MMLMVGESDRCHEDWIDVVMAFLVQVLRSLRDNVKLGSVDAHLVVDRELVVNQ